MHCVRCGPHVLFDSVHLLFDESRLPVECRDEGADVADDVGEEQSADEEGKSGEVTLGVL